MESEKLKELYNEGIERVGFILLNGEVIEVQNISSNPAEGFDIRGEDILRYMPEAVATWHTHPGETSNLSVNDYDTFMSWPDHSHFIIGSDGVKRFYVEDGELLTHDA